MSFYFGKFRLYLDFGLPVGEAMAAALEGPLLQRNNAKTKTRLLNRSSHFAQSNGRLNIIRRVWCLDLSHCHITAIFFRVSGAVFI